MAYSKPARTTTRRIRIRRIRVAGLLVVIAAIAAALGYQLLASSPSTAESPPIDVLRNEHRSALGEAPPSTVWPAHGQAAFVQTGRSQVQAGPNQHAAAIASLAKVMTAYLVLRDHPLRLGQDGPTLTVADTVNNTNTLLGHNGFVGVKTGSDDAAGGCFAFRAIRWIDGKRTTITGVVLGQPGHDQIAAGLAAAAAMVDRIAGHRAVPDPPQLAPASGALPRLHARQRTGFDAI